MECPGCVAEIYNSVPHLKLCIRSRIPVGKSVPSEKFICEPSQEDIITLALRARAAERTFTEFGNQHMKQMTVLTP